MLVTQVMELVRDGHSLSSVMDLGRQMLGRRQVIPGIAEMLDEVQVRQPKLRPKLSEPGAKISYEIRNHHSNHHNVSYLSYLH